MGSFKEHKFIVLCYDHYNPLGIIRSLGEEGIRPIVILASNRPFLIPKSKYISALHIVSCAEESIKLLLENYGNEALMPFVYSTDDTAESLLDQNYNLLKDKFYFFHGKDKGIITQLMNKDTINYIAEKNGFKIPKSEVLHHGVLPTCLRYPIMTKAINSIKNGWKNDVFICHNDKELLAAYEKIQSRVIIAQEYITKKNELCLDGYSTNNGNNIYIPYEVTFNRFSSKSYGAYINLKPFENQAILNGIQKILQAAGFNGMFEVEFIIDKDDILYFLEVNFRSSIWNYAFTYGGVNMPYLWAKSTLEQSFYKGNNALLQHYTAMNEIADFKENVLGKKISIIKWLKDFRKVNCLLYFNKKDVAPFFSKIIRYLFYAHN